MKSRLALIAASASACGLQLRLHRRRKIWPFYKKPKPAPEAVHELDLVNADGTPASLPAVLEAQHAGHRSVGRERHRHRWRPSCRSRPPGRCASRCACGRAASSRWRCRARSATCSPVAREGALPIDLELAPSVLPQDHRRLSTSPGAPCRSSRKRAVEPESRLRVADGGAGHASPRLPARNRSSRRAPARSSRRQKPRRHLQPSPPPGN